MKKPLLVLLWLLLALILPSCQPYMTYDEMTDAHAASTDPEEKTKLEKRIESFERDAERAQHFYEAKHVCEIASHSVWLCVGSSIEINRRTSPKTLDELVKAYRTERHVCGCARRDNTF